MREAAAKGEADAAAGGAEVMETAPPDWELLGQRARLIGGTLGEALTDGLALTRKDFEAYQSLQEGGNMPTLVEELGSAGEGLGQAISRRDGRLRSFAKQETPTRTRTLPLPLTLSLTLSLPLALALALTLALAPTPNPHASPEQETPTEQRAERQRARASSLKTKQVGLAAALGERASKDASDTVVLGVMPGAKVNPNPDPRPHPRPHPDADADADPDRNSNPEQGGGSDGRAAHRRRDRRRHRRARPEAGGLPRQAAP